MVLICFEAYRIVFKRSNWSGRFAIMTDVFDVCFPFWEHLCLVLWVGLGIACGCWRTRNDFLPHLATSVVGGLVPPKVLPVVS